MRLSEAIRLGAMIRPQGFHAYIRAFMGDDEVTCALGAAAQAIGSQYLDDDEVIAELDTAFGTLLNAPRRRCPVKDCGVRRVTANVITHLNDDHRWTREQIADWVESLEVASDVRADGESTVIAAARSQRVSGVHVGDREEGSCVGV